MGLSSAAVDYTSVVASDYNCEGVLNGDGDGVVKKCSHVPSVMSSFDYTEMLQPPPPTAATPGHRNAVNPSQPPAYPSAANIGVTTPAPHGREIQLPEAVQRDCKSDGYARTYSENL